MAKSLQERTAELQNRKFSGAPAINIPQTKVKGGFDSAVEDIIGLSNVFKKIESKILEKEKVSNIKDLSVGQLAKYGVKTALLTSRKNEMALSFQNDAQTETYKEMLRQGVFPTRIANAVIGQRLMPQVPTKSEEVPTSKLTEATLSSPETFLGKAGASELATKESLSRTREMLREKFLFGKLIFGKSEADFSGQTPSEGEDMGFVGGLVSDIKQRGALKFMWGNTLKDPQSKQRDYVAELLSFGYTRDEADKKSSAYLFENGKGLTEIEKAQLDKVEYTRKAWSLVEAIDMFPAFKAARTTMSKSLFRDVIQKAMVTPNAAEARRVLLESIPQLNKGKDIDSLVEMIVTTKDPLKGDYFLREIIDATEPVSTGARTEAQKIAYKDGVPVLQATPTSGVDELVTFRDQIRNVLRGAKEEARLSNANVLTDEIKAGSLPFKQASDGTVEVFATRNIARLRNGERVSLSSELAKDALGGARKFTANIDDLVRLEDGTFAYAPKKFINDSAEPSIKMIALNKQKAVETIERTAKETARKEKSAREALEKSKRLADEQEVSRIAKEDAARIAREATQKTQATKTIKDAPMEIAKRRADIDIEVAKDVAKIKSDETVAKAFVKSRIENVRTAVSGVKSAEKKVKVIQKALAKAKKEGRATTRISQVLAKAKSDLKTANTTKRSADSALNKAKKSIPTDTKVKITQAKAKADIRKAELLEESKKSVAEAKASLRDIQSSTKTSAPSARQTERLQNKIDKLEGKKAKLVEAYGSIDEVPASKIKEIDDAITELGNVTKINIDSLAKSSDPVGDFSVARGLDDVKVQETLNDVLKWISTGARGQLDKTIIESIDSLNIRPNDSVTLYRIGKVDDTEFQSWSRIKPPEGTEFTEKTFTPDKVLIDTTAPEMQILYREDAEALRVLQGFNKTEAEVMIKPKSLITTKEVTGGKITPVKIDGTDTSISTLMNRLNDGLKNVPESPEFNVATHAKQTENALDHIAKNGINETLSLIEKGEFPTNTTKASMVSALMESIEAVTDSALKLNYTDRLAAYIPELSEFTTRAGQEIEALKVLHRDNPVMKIMRIQKQLNSKKALKSVDSEVTKLEKQLSKVDTKGIIKEAIDKFTC